MNILSKNDITDYFYWSKIIFIIILNELFIYTKKVKKSKKCKWIYDAFGADQLLNVLLPNINNSDIF